MSNASGTGDDASADDLEDLSLFREFAESKRRSTRNRLVERHMGLATHIASRYRRPGTSDDDLRQVAMLGLVKAVDRFDPEFGSSFSAFAGRTIEGEIKRHFRDGSWTVRVPRGAKELHLLVRRASDELSQRLGRSPNVDEIAEQLGLTRDDVLRGLSASAAYKVDTLDGDGTEDDDGTSDRQSELSTIDAGFADTENRAIVEKLLLRLPDREREIVTLRFFDRLSQDEIAESIGVSQMHVSRILRRSFEQMRSWLVETPDEG